ncbi:nitrile hydratase subunit alpha [Rhodococcus qingshengii]|uniref:nitrile hydratase subunit alpha n=1 Tax=Rhodococcus qingshengii TaxID=334542 RepID=UPI001C5E6B5F|nr:nitrile hydratase subunit alpha [Rhodococcus qingshengii]MBW4818769.1 nitrile hydratase subunit alpha [Rhodococcus qingshengii]
MSEHVNKYTEYEARTKAIETLLFERGIVTPTAVDRIVSYYENDVGPMGGAKIVAKAWTDPDYAEWLKKDATAAMADMGYAGEQAHQIQAVFNDKDTHHVVVCTLCSCYPWPVLGLPPAWYKSMEYRSRVVADPRAVLKSDFGFEVPDDTEVRVWDSSSEIRYIVIPEQPKGTEAWDAEALTKLVSRDSMIGVADALKPNEVVA